jgi:hypothetical protein
MNNPSKPASSNHIGCISVVAIVAITIAAYLGSEHGSYRANEYAARVANERREKREAVEKIRQNTESENLRKIIETKLTGETGERWKKYDKCISLGAVRAGLTTSSAPKLNAITSALGEQNSDGREFIVPQLVPSWLEFCLTGSFKAPPPAKDQSPTDNSQ